MSTMKEDIKDMRKHIEKGSFFSYYDKSFPGFDAYAAVSRVLDAAESTLPKTVTKYGVTATRMDGTKIETSFKKDVPMDHYYYPYTTRKGAVEFAYSLLKDQAARAVEITEGEVEVD